MRAEAREFEHQLASGKLFAPSQRELESATIPAELAANPWLLHPEHYAGKPFYSPEEAIAAAELDSEGLVALVTECGDQFNVAFTQRYAVCEYRNEIPGDIRCAYEKSNMRRQVPEEWHVMQGCPCCGVELSWYPSRFHMPKSQAFKILKDVVAQRLSPGVQWLEYDDDYRTTPGHG